MKRIIKLSLVAVYAVACAISFFPGQASAAFNKDLLMDDVVFSDTGSMSAAQIDAMLNSRNSCISPNSGFRAILPNGYSPSGGYQYGDFVTAGMVIATAAQAYDINPQVLIVTLQKEQSLITSTSCSTNTIAKAAGYACPDSGGSYSYSGINLYHRSGTTYTSVSGICVNSAAKAGFSQQVIRAAWLLKFSQQRALGNTGWAIIRGSWNNSDDPQTCYSGAMTQGTLKRCHDGPATYYDGYTVIDGTGVHMDTGATAALYRYTPHFHGNQNFVNLFESWFGSTVSAGYYSCGLQGANVAGAPSGDRIVGNKLGGGPENLSHIILNNTGSKCIEAHTWTSTMQQWLSHVATNRPSLSPADADIITTDGNGDGRDELMTIEYRNTSSGMVEVHIWDNTYQRWLAHIATNRPAIDPANAEVIPADTNGDGRDELFLVEYRNNGSGTVEIHGWSPNLKGWVLHSTTAHSAVDPADNNVIAGDPDGDGRDSFLLVKYANNGSSMVEVHGFTSDFRGWASHIATNHTAVSHADNDVILYDSNGDGRDEFTLTKLRNTGSGRMETHVWNPTLQGWISHNAAVQ